MHYKRFWFQALCWTPVNGLEGFATAKHYAPSDRGVGEIFLSPRGFGSFMPPEGRTFWPVHVPMDAPEVIPSDGSALIGCYFVKPDGSRRVDFWGTKESWDTAVAPLHKLLKVSRVGRILNFAEGNSLEHYFHSRAYTTVALMHVAQSLALGYPFDSAVVSYESCIDMWLTMRFELIQADLDCLLTVCRAGFRPASARIDTLREKFAGEYTFCDSCTRGLIANVCQALEIPVAF